MPRELLLRVYLVTRQKKQKRQTEIGEEPDGVGDLDEPRHVRTEEGAGYQKEHGFGISLPGMSLATMGQMSATSAMTASETRSWVMKRLP